MTKAIGLLELNSIAKGLETSDIMIKSGEIELLMAKPICPGKFIILVTGDVGSVKASIEKGIETSSFNLIDKLILPKVHSQVIESISSTTRITKFESLGVLEFFSIATSIIAADAIAKTSQVELIELRLGIGIGGKSFVTFTGDLSSVNEAAEVGANIGKENGMLFNKVVIPSPSQDLIKYIL